MNLLATAMHMSARVYICEGIVTLEEINTYEYVYMIHVRLRPPTQSEDLQSIVHVRRFRNSVPLAGG